jgi:hypothetical protein
MRTLIFALVGVTLQGQSVSWVSGAGGENPGAARENKSPANQISLLAQDWELFGSSNVPRNPEQLSVGWQFILPQYDDSLVPCYLAPPNACQGVGAAETIYTSPMAGKTMSMTVSISSSPTFGYQTQSSNTCVAPASVRLSVEKRNYAGQAYYGWWSNPAAITLAGGTFTVSIPVDPAQWSSVYGEFGNASSAATKGFNDAFKNPYKVRMAFGGGCFFGHGVYQNNPASGQSLFRLLNFSIQ